MYIPNDFVEEFDKFVKTANQIEKAVYKKEREQNMHEKWPSKKYEFIRKDFTVIAIRKLILLYNKKYGEKKDEPNSNVNNPENFSSN